MSKDQQILIVMRHGDLAHDDVCGLSQKGRSQIQNHAHILKEHGLSPDMIIPSIFERTQQTAGVLSDVFNVERAKAINLERTHTFEFDVFSFLSSIPDNKKCVLLAGHDETIQCFGHRLLDDADTALLFQMLSGDRYHRHNRENDTVLLKLRAGFADALLLSSHADESFDRAQWSLYGWLEDGKIEYARDYKSISPHIFSGRKVSDHPEFPEILYESYTSEI